MKVKNICLKSEGEFVLLTADCNIRHFGSDRIYFKVDRKYKDFIVTDASPFAAALLIPAMKLGQNLIIEGSISEQLYQGMHEIMKIMVSWNIGLKPIAISVDALKKDDYTSTKNATFFSGGVDSFYTYLKNKKDRDLKINYLILANGYDIALSNKKLWDMTCRTVEDVAREEGVEVIKIESNVRDLIEPIIGWGYTHGGCLAALGLALRRELRNISIASTFSYNQLLPWGSHPDTDCLWGTETLLFCHHGIEATRVEKIQFIAGDPIILKHLRVCYFNKKDQFNCGACNKCLMTMIGLRIAGILERSETFPSTINLTLVRKMKILGEPRAVYTRENLMALEKLNIDPPLQDALRQALNHISFSRPYVMEIAVRVWFLDYYYNRSRVYKAIDFVRKKYY